MCITQAKNVRTAKDVFCIVIYIVLRPQTLLRPASGGGMRMSLKLEHSPLKLSLPIRIYTQELALKRFTQYRGGSVRVGT